MLQVTGPVPAQPVCDTKVAPAGMASVMVTVVTVAAAVVRGAERVGDRCRRA